MNKYSLTLLLAIAGCFMVPMTSSAATAIAAATSLSGSVAFAPSKSVTLEVISTSTDYAATSGHMQGTEYYGALSSSTSIFVKKDVTPAGTAAALATALSSLVTSSTALDSTISSTTK